MERLREKSALLGEYLFTQLSLQKPQGFLWLPVFFALGVAFYFGLRFEPPLALGILGFLISLSFISFTHGDKDLSEKAFLKWLAAMGLCLVAAGFLCAQLRTHFIHTPLLEKEIRTAEIVGTVKAIETLEEGEGVRLLLGGLEIEKLSQDETPIYIRLKLREQGDIRIGQRIKALAGLNPPSPPVYPGAFDFQRYAYFKSIGAVGFIYRAPEILEEGHDGDFQKFIEGAREVIEERIDGALAPPQAGVVKALLVGEKKAIAEEDVQAMRDSGLAHMLAISGLHVGLFSSFIFFLVRAGLAFITRLAEQYPIKKYAAFAAMVGALIYMLLAGATIPTQRAVLMTGIVLLAVILDRSAISMRLVAFAALVVLAIAPESLFSASFHMSFAAVTALVAFYEWLRPWWSERSRRNNLPQKAGMYLLGVCLTTVIAGFATGIFALYHFQNFALYGVLGNLVAVPILTFFIMPAGVMSLFLMPLGLEEGALWLMGQGAEQVLDIAHWVAGIEGSVYQVPQWPPIALLGFVSGALFLILWRGSLRPLGLIPILVGFVSIYLNAQPDILISSKHNLFGYAPQPGELYVSSKRADQFTLEQWERYYGVPEDGAQKWPRQGEEEGLTCGERGCRLPYKGQNISFLYQDYDYKEACNWADMVIAVEILASWKCEGAEVINRIHTKKEGARALYIQESGIKQITVEDLRGARPWVR